MYDVLIAPSATRDLDKIRPPDIDRLKKQILALGSNPRPPGAKKLKDHLYRIRVGAWRVLYVVEDKEEQVTVLRVIRRSERTYRNI